MSYVTECPTCRRTVGVIQRIQGGRRPLDGPRYKLSVHSSVPPTGVKGERRPRCSATGYEVADAVLIETELTPQQRKSAELAAARALAG
jgi:hypothetical protein